MLDNEFCKISVNGAYTVVVPSKGIGSEESEALIHIVDHLLEKPCNIALDLQNVDLIGSYGLSVIVGANNEVKNNGRKFILGNLCPDVYGLLKMSGLHEKLDIVEDLDGFYKRDMASRSKLNQIISDLISNELDDILKSPKKQSPRHINSPQRAHLLKLPALPG